MTCVFISQASCQHHPDVLQLIHEGHCTLLRACHTSSHSLPRIVSLSCRGASRRAGDSGRGTQRGAGRRIAHDAIGRCFCGHARCWADAAASSSKIDMPLVSSQTPQGRLHATCSGSWPPPAHASACTANGVLLLMLTGATVLGTDPATGEHVIPTLPEVQPDGKVRYRF